MNEIVEINFGEIVNELEEKKLQLLTRKGFIFLEDKQGNIYKMEEYHLGSYLDQLIRNNIKVEFFLVGENQLEKHEVERLSVEDVKEFISRQSKYW